jgi:hypothetical protein
MREGRGDSQTQSGQWTEGCYRKEWRGKQGSVGPCRMLCLGPAARKISVGHNQMPMKGSTMVSDDTSMGKLIFGFYIYFSMLGI